MKPYLLLLQFVLFVACKGEPMVKVDVRAQSILDKVKERFAPDKRVVIFNVQLLGDNPIVILGETNLPFVKDTLFQKLDRAKIKWLDSLTVLSPTYALVNVSVCNIRSLPRHSAELATQSLMGTPLRVYKEEQGWYYVQTPDNYLGWLDGGGLVLQSKPRFDRWMKGEKIVVTDAFSFVKSSLEHSNISDVVEGNILRKVGSQGSYDEVALPDGRSGIIDRSSVVAYSDFIEVSKPLLENILITAHQFLGRPYMWGGTSGKAMDCSGFTKTVFYLNGLELPRDASQQVYAGIEVETDTSLQNLYPGDFLFFGRKANDSQKERITHVGIYLGDGKMIHASEMVRIQSLKRGEPNFAQERLNTLVRAKRMLDNIGANGVHRLKEHQWYSLTGE